MPDDSEATDSTESSYKPKDEPNSLDLPKPDAAITETDAIIEKRNLDLAKAQELSESREAIIEKDLEIARLREAATHTDISLPMGGIPGVGETSRLFRELDSIVYMDPPSKSVLLYLTGEKRPFDALGRITYPNPCFSLFGHHTLYIVIRDGLLFGCASFKEWDKFYGLCLSEKFSLSLGIRFDFLVIVCFSVLLPSCSSSDIFQKKHSYSNTRFSCYIGAFYGCAYLHVFKSLVLAYTRAEGYSIPNLEPSAFSLITSGIFSEVFELISFMQQDIALEITQYETVNLCIQFNSVRINHPFGGSDTSEKAPYYLTVGYLALLSFLKSRDSNSDVIQALVSLWIKLFCSIEGFIKIFDLGGQTKAQSADFQFLNQLSANSGFWDNPFDFDVNQEAFSHLTAWYLFTFQTIIPQDVKLVDIRRTAKPTFPNSRLFMCFNTNEDLSGNIFSPTSLFQDQIVATFRYLNMVTINLTSLDIEKSAYLAQMYESKFGNLTPIIDSRFFIGTEFTNILPQTLFKCSNIFTLLQVHDIVMNALDLNLPTLPLFTYSFTRALEKSDSDKIILVIAIESDKMFISKITPDKNCVTIEKGSLVSLKKHFPIVYATSDLQGLIETHLLERK